MLSPRSFRAELHVLKEGGDEQNQGEKQWDNNKFGLELPVGSSNDSNNNSSIKYR